MKQILKKKLVLKYHFKKYSRHVMEVEVVLLPSLPSEIFVDLGSSADLSCLTSHRDDIEVTWQKDYKDVLNFNTHTDTVCVTNLIFHLDVC